jgi:GT2 family glycosyltransferase
MYTPLVFIIILNYNGFIDTKDCINSIMKIYYLNYKIVVVDNHSTDNSYEKLEHNFGNRIIILRNGSNLGYAAGNNVGIRFALENGADYILILNNDTIIYQNNFLDILVQEAESIGDLGIIGPKILQPNGDVDWTCARTDAGFKEIIWAYSFIGRKIFKNNKTFKRHTYNFYNDIKSVSQVYAISGSCMLIKRNAMEKMDILDENTFLYEEEFIISSRAAKLGYKIYTHPEVVIIHKGAQTSLRMKAFSKIENVKSEQYFLHSYKKMSKLKIFCIKLIRLFEYSCFLYQKDYRALFDKFILAILK